ncbi:MAG: HAD-IIA family hydrolase [Desulfobacterales bacterium]|nr:HAD-IIA family hydrolase [Nitrospinaceae bacterium]MDP6807653.1 HAD-IIA family hydrolase [Desulfobacterales bacterium]
MERQIKGIVFDIDGCVARGNRAIEGVPETMAELRRRDIRFAFLTNDNQNTVAFLAEKLTGMGIPASEEEVLTSAIIAARTIRELHPDSKILAFGGPGLIEALCEQGLCLLEHEQMDEAEVVVMGKDPDFNQQRLILACKAIWNGADFIATNYDQKIPVADGFVPASGPMIKAVAYATDKEPLVTGKPSRWSGNMAMKVLGVPAENGAVVGDRLQQDIAMGKVAGLYTVLVLTGGTTQEEAENAPEELKPDLILPDVNHLLEHLV